jgi:hypothetical protein
MSERDECTNLPFHLRINGTRFARCWTGSGIEPKRADHARRECSPTCAHSWGLRPLIVLTIILIIIVLLILCCAPAPALALILAAGSGYRCGPFNTFIQCLPDLLLLSRSPLPLRPALRLPPHRLAHRFRRGRKLGIPRNNVPLYDIRRTPAVGLRLSTMAFGTQTPLS